MIKTCLQCETPFSVPKTREVTAKFCSRACADKFPRVKHTVNCAECGKPFHRKKSQAERAVIWGNFCSTSCSSVFRSRKVAGEGNPNAKGRNYDADGYRLYTPQASLKKGYGKIKLHHAITFDTLGISKLPKGYHVHHKDCDVLNNAPENLQIILISDHKWLHKEFGSATLWAFEKGKIATDAIVSWSSDPQRAKFLLLSNLLNQKQMLETADLTNEVTFTKYLTENKEYFEVKL